jgi:hypothetical protein
MARDIKAAVSYWGRADREAALCIRVDTDGGSPKSDGKE